ncbi:hypothetical protein KKD52_16215 [Myxococcota bacterium]|nr:hypothetical protein [Myxococcota bacterium]MBU1412142.1 hypothetical protein [Myxococcota bacterium]MBU1511900.1 hypothetical protein [Myxococcota bacterium]
MPTCHVTGIEIGLSEALVLNAPAAARLLHRRLHQVRLLEMLLKEYGRMAAVQTMDAEGLPVMRRQARLICEAIADAWVEELEGSSKLFLLFSEWRMRRHEWKKTSSPKSVIPDAAEAANED